MSASRKSDLSYEIVRSRRTTADIVVERDGRVVVRVPKTIAHQRIEDLVEVKRYWIFKTLAEWRDLNATKVLREYQIPPVQGCRVARCKRSFIAKTRTHPIWYSV